MGEVGAAADDPDWNPAALTVVLACVASARRRRWISFAAS